MLSKREIILQDLKEFFVEAYKFFRYDLDYDGYKHLIELIPDTKKTFREAFLNHMEFKSASQIIFAPFGIILLACIHFTLQHKVEKFERKHPEYFL